MPKTFWKRALASLPPSVQRRYAAQFEAAERFDERLDIAIAMWRSARRALAMAVHPRRAARRDAAEKLPRLLMQ